MSELKMVPAICTQCGAKLDVDSSKDAAICPYCNTPFIVEKAITKYNTEYHIEHADIHVESFGASVANTIKNYQNNKHRERMMELEAEAEKERRKNEPLPLGHEIVNIALTVFILAVIIIGWGFIFKDIAAQRKKEAELEKIVVEIQTDLENEDYNAARMKANRLRFIGGNKETVKKWDKVREETLELIDELQYGKKGTQDDNLDAEALNKGYDRGGVGKCSVSLT